MKVLNLLLKKTKQPPCVFRLQQLKFIYSHFDVDVKTLFFPTR